VIIGAKTVAVFLALVSLAGGHFRGPSVPPPAISAAVIGDSYTAAFGTDPEHSWQRYATLDLGWRLDAVRGYPGAGYVNPGTGGPYEAGLAAAPLPATVDQVLVEGGFNDIAYGPEEVAAALTRTLALIRAQAPQAEITVVGTFDPGPGTFSHDYPNLHGNAPVVQRAVEAAGARYVDGFQFHYEVGPDGVHPSPTGHAELGHGIASAIRYLAPHAAGARSTTVTSRRAAVIGVSRVDAAGARWFFVASTEGGALGPARRVAFGEAGDVPTLLPNAAGECVPAVYRPSTGTLYAASRLVDGGGEVQAIPFGNPGDQPVQNAPYATPGDRTVFLHRPAQSTFYEGAPGPDGQRDVAGLEFGRPGDRGLLYTVAGVGTTVGVYRPGTSTFHLADPRATSVAAETSVALGAPGDQGLVGAWGWHDVTGSDRVGVFRPSTAQWFLADTPTQLTGGPTTPVRSVTSFFFGDPGDTALACDPQ
jgi:lysophospholipase L1-like esterase